MNESTNDVTVLIGGAGGTFSAAANLPVGVTPQSVVVGDFNRDSDPDLAVPNGGSNDVSVLVGGAGASFSAPTNFAAGFFPISVELKDFNGDSDLDLAVVNEASNDVSVFLGGTGRASARPPTSLSGPGRNRSRWESSTATRTPTWRSQTNSPATCRCCWAGRP